MRLVRLLLLPVAIFAGVASAQTIDQCKQIKDAAKRVGCFDKATATPKKPDKKLTAEEKERIAAEAQVEKERKAAEEERVAKKSLTETLIAKAENAIRSIMFDPDSAKFSEVIAAKLESGYGACGMVNAKNRMGGYTGSQMFYVEFSQDMLVIAANSFSLNYPKRDADAMLKWVDGVKKMQAVCDAVKANIEGGNP